MEHEIAQLAQALRAQNEQNAKMMGMFGRMASANSSPNDQRKMERDLFSKPADRFSRNIDSMRASTDQWNRAMGSATRASDKVSSSFKLLGQDASAAQSALSGMAKTLLGGALGGVVIGGLINYVSGLTSAYQGMAEIGQTFGGNLLGMSKAAAESQMTLERYATVMKANSELAAAMGAGGNGRKSMGQMMASVREASKAAGLFGYTMEGLDEMTASYMETSRAQGHLETLSNAQNLRNIQGMAKETAALSTVYGKSRTEINKVTTEIMQSAAIVARLNQTTGAQYDNTRKVFDQSIRALASLPGESGKLLASTMGEMFGANGNLGLVTGFKDIFNKLGPSADILTRAYDKLQKATDTGDTAAADEATVELTNSMRRLAKENMPLLQQWAAQKHLNPQLGAAAEQFIKIGTLTKDMTKAEQEAARKRIEAIDKETALMLSLGQSWAEISSKARMAFLPLLDAPLKAFADGVTKFAESPAYAQMTDQLGKISTEMTKWAGELAKPEKLKVFSDWFVQVSSRFAAFVQSIQPSDITRLFDGIIEFGKLIGSVITAVSQAALAVAGFGKMLYDSTALLSPILKGIGATFDMLGIGLKELVIGLGVAYAAFKGFQLYKFFSGIRNMEVRAANVNINGRGLGGFGGGGHGGGGGGGKGKGGRLRRMGRGIAGGAAGLAGLALGGLDLLNGPVADKLSEFGSALFGAKKGAEAAAEGVTGTATVKGKGEVPKAPEVKAGTAAADAAKGAAEVESAAAKGLRASKLIKGLGVLGTVLSTIDGGMQVYDLNERSKAEGWDDNKFREELTKLLAPMLTGTAGALAGGALGAAGGTLVAPGIGSLIGGIGGAIGGGLGGDKLGEMIAPLIVDAIKKAPVEAKTGEQFGPPIPANLKSPGEVDPGTVSKKIDEYLNGLAEMRRSDGINNEKLLEQLTKVGDLIRQQSEMQAQLLNRNNETVKNTASNIVRASEANGN